MTAPTACEDRQRLAVAIAALHQIAATGCTDYADPSPSCRHRDEESPADWCPACVAATALAVIRHGTRRRQAC
jgi:hypothetical protein